MLPVHLPPAQIFLPGTGEPALRWGLIGPGWIAGEFVRAVHAHTEQRFVVVASRSTERAAQFASQHGIEHAVGSVDALLARPDVDVVYIATPPSDHLSSGLAAIAAGKHVIIEKPLALDGIEGQQLVDAAARTGMLVMEAMWSRYLPQTSVIRTLVDDGVLGTVRMVHADHGQAITTDPQHRLYRPELGGGALLDLGIYPVQLDSMILGSPSKVVATGGLTSTGVDAYATLVLQHGEGAQSTLTTTMHVRTPSRATIAGSEGRIELGPFFFGPGSFTVHSNDPGLSASHRTWDDSTGLTGFDALSWEATALARFVGGGRTESPLHTLEETVSILATIPEARSQIEGTQAGAA